MAVWVLAAGYRHARGSLARSLAVLVAGAVLGLATAVRSNGLASGLLFAVEALQAAGAFAQTPGVAPVVAAGAAGARRHLGGPGERGSAVCRLYHLLRRTRGRSTTAVV